MTGETIVHTHCHICEQLCGITVAAVDGVVTSIRPDKANPYTWRDFCVKAQRAGDVAASPARLLQPMRRVGDRFVPASYEEAVTDIAARLSRIVDEHGVDAVGSYLGNPAGFNFGSAAFHAGFMAALGSHQTYSISSIDNNAYHVAVDRMFGLEWLALVPDVDQADCFLFVGSNPAISKFNWLGKVPNGWRRVTDRLRAGADLIIVDPRRVESAEKATLYVAPYPEEDWALLLGMIKVIFDKGWARLPTEAAIEGLDGLRDLAASYALALLAGRCGVPEAQIVEAARSFATAKRGFAFAATGPALGRNGTLTHWLTMALNVITDRLDRPGGRFMPNWPMNFAVYKERTASKSKVPSRVRGLPPVVGMHSVSEMADEILTPGKGQIRALMLDGGNPVSCGPDGGKMDRAFESLELLVAVDLFQRESQRHAHWLIPGQHFLERGELHVGLNATNDRPYIQSARAAVPTPPTVRPEWTFYRDLAAAMGLTLFGGRFEPTPDNVSRSLLAIGEGAPTIDEVRAAEHGLIFGERTMGHLWAYLAGTGRAIDVAPASFVERLQDEIATRVAPPAGTFRIISRRRNGMMNSWLAETSGAVSPDTTAQSVEINREDAYAAGIAEGDALLIRSDTGEVRAVAQLSDAIRTGVLVLVHGWGTPLFDAASGEVVFKRGQDRNKLVSDTDIDPLSAVARFNGTPVTVERIASEAAGSVPQLEAMA
jgi:formate dehydrogenase